MITITKRVEAIVERWPFIKQAIELDLLNTSALARYLRPQLEAELGERISEAAVIMALRRYVDMSHPTATLLPQQYLGDLSIRSNLNDLTYTNSPSLNRRIAQLSQQLNPQLYLTVSRGLLQTSIIVHTDARLVVHRQLHHEQLETEVLGLTAVTLHLKPGHDAVAGILAYPLNLLAWRGITVVEVVSTFDELNIVLYDKDVEEAFRTINAALT